MATKGKPLTIEFTPEERRHLEAVATVRGCSVEHVVREAIAAFAGSPRNGRLTDGELAKRQRADKPRTKPNGPSAHFYISRVPIARLLDGGLAITHATVGNLRSLSRLRKDDRMLLYAYPAGVIAVGTVSSPWDRREHKMSRSTEESEYRLSIQWRQLDKPLSPAQVIEGFNCVPVKVLQRISLELADVERLLK
jgi:hypothetical protein